MEGGEKTRIGIRRNLNSKVCSYQSMQATEDVWHYYRSVLQSVTVEQC